MCCLGAGFGRFLGGILVVGGGGGFWRLCGGGLLCLGWGGLGRGRNSCGILGFLLWGFGGVWGLGKRFLGLFGVICCYYRGLLLGNSYFDRGGGLCGLRIVDRRFKMIILCLGWFGLWGGIVGMNSFERLG